MIRRFLGQTSVIGLCVAAFVAGCSKGADAPKADSSSASTAAGAGASAGGASAAATPTPAAPAAPALTDAAVLGKLDFDNVHDSTGGSMAAQKGTNASVKEFGRMMMKDHHAMRVEGMALAKKANVTPATPTDADATADKAAEDSLTAVPKGAAWDKMYIDHQIEGHQKVLQFAQDAANSTQNADLKAMIQKATPTVQKHLDKAKAIQGKLSAKP